MASQCDLFEIRPRIVLLEGRRRMVAALLRDMEWHTTAEINAPDVGGSEGTRRLRELRAVGYIIDQRRRENSDQWEYRLND